MITYKEFEVIRSMLKSKGGNVLQNPFMKISSIIMCLSQKKRLQD